MEICNVYAMKKSTKKINNTKGFSIKKGQCRDNDDIRANEYAFRKDKTNLTQCHEVCANMKECLAYDHFKHFYQNKCTIYTTNDLSQLKAYTNKWKLKLGIKEKNVVKKTCYVKSKFADLFPAGGCFDYEGHPVGIRYDDDDGRIVHYKQKDQGTLKIGSGKYDKSTGTLSWDFLWKESTHECANSEICDFTVFLGERIDQQKCEGKKATTLWEDVKSAVKYVKNEVIHVKEFVSTESKNAADTTNQITKKAGKKVQFFIQEKIIETDMKTKIYVHITEDIQKECDIDGDTFHKPADEDDFVKLITKGLQKRDCSVEVLNLKNIKLTPIHGIEIMKSFNNYYNLSWLFISFTTCKVQNQT
jgi:hypothetical protein